MNGEKSGPEIDPRTGKPLAKSLEQLDREARERTRRQLDEAPVVGPSPRSRDTGGHPAVPRPTGGGEMMRRR